MKQNLLQKAVFMLYIVFLHKCIGVTGLEIFSLSQIADRQSTQYLLSDEDINADSSQIFIQDENRTSKKYKIRYKIIHIASQINKA